MRSPISTKFCDETGNVWEAGLEDGRVVLTVPSSPTGYEILPALSALDAQCLAEILKREADRLLEPDDTDYYAPPA